MEINENENNKKLRIEQNFYSCDKCNKTPKILFIDYMKKEIQFNCEEHKINTSKINDYLDSISESALCQNCFKNNINLDNKLKYCSICNIRLCNHCSNDHINKFNNHILYDKKDYNIRCNKHINEYYIGYCNSCKENICNDCKKSRIHKNHQKFDYIEIQPTKEDLNIIKIFNLKIVDKMNNLKNQFNSKAFNDEKTREINIISEKYNKLFVEINNKWENTIKKHVDELRKEKENELLKNSKLKDDEIHTIIIKYKEKENYYKNNIENQLKNYKNIIKLNKIIINSYKNQKDYNLYYNENINNIIESINIYNQNLNLQYLKELKDKFKIYINNENTSFKVKNDKLDNTILNDIFNSKFNNLKEINISSSSLNSLDFLSKNNFNNLEKLVFFECPINDIDILSSLNFNSLLELKISKTKINNINALIGENFINLKILNLSRNKIDNIDVLKDVKFNDNLLELYLDNNNINDISVFSNEIFSNLKILFLSYNSIKDIFPLKFILINCCESLTLDNNKISNIEIFNNINNFFELKELALLNNPINYEVERNKIIRKMIKDKKIKFY